MRDAEVHALLSLIIQIPFDLQIFNKYDSNNLGNNRPVGRSIQIYVAPEHLDTALQALEENLSSAQIFQAKLSYHLSQVTTSLSSSTAATTINSTHPPCPKDKNEAIQALQSLFGDSFDEIAHLFSGAGARFEHGILYSKKAVYAFKQTREAQARAIMLHFNQQDIASIRQAWSNSSIHLPAPTAQLADLEPHQYGLAHGNLNQCIGIRANSDSNEAEMFIDVKMLYQLTFPVMTETKGTTPSGKVIIEIDEQHFLNNLKQVAQGNFLLRVYKDGEKYEARPAFLGDSARVAKPHTHILVIDISVSLDTCYRDSSNQGIVQQIFAFLELLRQQDPDSKVQLVFFGENTHHAGCFPVQQLEDIKSTIRTYTAVRECSTRLFGTCKEVFQQIASNQNSADISVTLFTDGCETSDDATKPEATTPLTSLPAIRRPKVMTVGLGKYDAHLLSELTVTAGGDFFHLSSIADLRQTLQNNISQMSSDRRLHQLAVALDQLTTTYDINVGADGATVPEIILPLRPNESGFVSVDGSRYQVQVRPSQTPAINMMDRLARFAATHTSLASEGNLAELQSSLCNFQRFVTSETNHMQTAERRYAESIINDTEANITRLSSACTDAARMSASIRAASQAGFHQQRPAVSSSSMSLESSAAAAAPKM